MKNCMQCGTELPSEANFCFQCGKKQFIPKQKIATYIDFERDVVDQLKTLFFEILKKQITEEQDPEQLTDYMEMLYRSGFSAILDRRMPQLAVQAESITEINSNQKHTQLKTFVNRQLEELSDFFIIHYCKEINKHSLPESILKYQGSTADTTISLSLIMDYLELDKTTETFYVDFLSMPIQKLKNASKSYLFPKKEEKILLIGDQSLLGNGKDGFALTEQALYWKAPFQKPKQTLYEGIQSIEKDKEWVLINGAFFNVTETINIRMMKLLRKLKQLKLRI